MELNLNYSGNQRKNKIFGENKKSIEKKSFIIIIILLILFA